MWTSRRYLRIIGLHKEARAPTIATVWTLRRPFNVKQVEDLATHPRITAMWTSRRYLRIIEFHKEARAPTIATVWTLRRPFNVKAG
jgi:hypothetical protein